MDHNHICMIASLIKGVFLPRFGQMSGVGLESNVLMPSLIKGTF